VPWPGSSSRRGGGAAAGLRDACGEVRDLVEFLVLGDVLQFAAPCADASELEPSRKPKAGTRARC
jgi:hypothetical protein